jgi:hypothetical protein
MRMRNGRALLRQAGAEFRVTCAIQNQAQPGQAEELVASFRNADRVGLEVGPGHLLLEGETRAVLLREVTLHSHGLAPAFETGTFVFTSGDPSAAETDQ